MVQLSFFDDTIAYWRLRGSEYEKMFYVHEHCGYTFPFAGYGYRLKPICPKCGMSMISFYFNESGV